MSNQKTMRRNQELVRYNNEQNYYDYDYEDDNDVNNIVKVLDKNGVSLQNEGALYKKNKYLSNDIRLSKNGSKPYVCYPDTDFSQEPEVIKVVKKYNEYSKEMNNARKSLNREANRISNNSAIVYQNELERIRLTTEKNLIAAKIDSLRLTNKAMIIEKNFNETYAENARHKQVMKDIDKLKTLLLENNDINLKEEIAKINLARELEIDNAKSNRDKISEKISEQMQINKVKNEFMKERIRILSTGSTPAKMNKELSDEIKRVKELKTFREKDDQELEVLYSALKRVDINKISDRNDRELAQRVIDKFETDKKIKNLYMSHMKENENKMNNSGKINTIKSRIFGIINKKYSANIDNELQKKIIVSAKKDTPFISMSVDKFMATQQRTLHSYFDEYPSKKQVSTKTSNTKSKKKKASKASSKKTPISNAPVKGTELVVTKKNKKSKPKKQQNRSISKNDNYYVNYFDDKYTSFDLNDDFFNQKVVKDAIRKWKKIEHHVESSNDFSVDSVDRDAYKIKYLAKERQSKSEKENFLNFLLEKKEARQEARNLRREALEFNKKQKVKQDNKKRASSLEQVHYYSEIKLMALRRRLEKLPSDPIVFNSQNSYEYKNLMYIISEFSQMSLRRLPKTPENDAFIIEVKQIIDFYDLLAKEDAIARRNIDKSIALDSKLKSSIVKQDARVMTKETQNNHRYQKEIAKIEQNSLSAKHKAEQAHRERIQKINNDIDWQCNNENDLHEKNKAFIKRTTADLEKRSHIYENDLISSITSEVNKFNAKQLDENNIISLKNMPNKIECHKPLVNGKIDLVEQEDGIYAVNRVYSRTSGSKTYTGKTLNKVLPSNITQVVVLDKFRNIQNPLARASALKELAEVNYSNAVKYNLSREKMEIAKANRELERAKEYSDSLIDDAYELNEYLQLVKSKSEYSSFVQREHLKRSKQKWKITEANLKRQYNIESEELRRLENRNKKLELAQKRIENKRQKYLSSIENDLLFENIRATNERKNADSTSSFKKGNSIVPYRNQKENKQNKISLSKRLLSLFRSKNDDLEEIIGKK